VTLPIGLGPITALEKNEKRCQNRGVNSRAEDVSKEHKILMPFSNFTIPPAKSCEETTYKTRTHTKQKHQSNKKTEMRFLILTMLLAAGVLATSNVKEAVYAPRRIGKRDAKVIGGAHFGWGE
jgi:hypothetical protein